MGKRKLPARLRRACNTLLLGILVCIIGVFSARLVARSADTPYIEPFETPGAGAQGVETPGVEAETEARAYTVVVDAGHGGADGGAVGSKTGVVEAGLNLAVASAVRDALEEAGVAVLMTRTDENALADTKQADMQARRAIMNTEGVDLVVSVHMNRFTDPAVSGPMAFYMKGSEAGQHLAELVIASVCEAIGRPVRSANPGDYFVIRESPAPSVLVECGFLSNAEDEALLQTEEHQQKLVRGIVDGVLAYLAETSGSGASARDGTALSESGES